MPSANAHGQDCVSQMRPSSRVCWIMDHPAPAQLLAPIDAAGLRSTTQPRPESLKRTQSHTTCRTPNSLHNRFAPTFKKTTGTESFFPNFLPPSQRNTHLLPAPAAKKRWTYHLLPTYLLPATAAFAAGAPAVPAAPYAIDRGGAALLVARPHLREIVCAGSAAEFGVCHDGSFSGLEAAAARLAARPPGVEAGEDAVHLV